MKIFIPIKQKSQRVPNKNFRDFGGVPLYKHTLYKLRGLDVYVDTDSDEIVEEAEKDPKLSHVFAFKRSPHLIGHDVSVNLLIEDFLQEIDDEHEKIVQLHVTNPFFNVETLEEVFLNYRKGGYVDSVFSVNVIQSRLWRLEGRGNDNMVPLPINHNPRVLEPTQDLSPLYEENSVFYMFSKYSFDKGKNRIGENPRLYPLSFPENLDIDTEEDWKICCAVLEMKK